MRKLVRFCVEYKSWLLSLLILLGFITYFQLGIAADKAHQQQLLTEFQRGIRQQADYEGFQGVMDALGQLAPSPTVQWEYQFTVSVREDECPTWDSQWAPAPATSSIITKWLYKEVQGSRYEEATWFSLLWPQHYPDRFGENLAYVGVSFTEDGFLPFTYGYQWEADKSTMHIKVHRLTSHPLKGGVEEFNQFRDKLLLGVNNYCSPVMEYGQDSSGKFMAGSPHAGG